MANRKAKYIMIKVLLEEMGKARILWELHYREESLAHQLSIDDFLQREIQEKKACCCCNPPSWQRVV